MRGWISRHWKWVAPIGVVGVLGLAWLAFGYFGVQTLFLDDKVDEAPPELAAETVADGEFVDRSHPAEGRAVVLTDGTSQRFLRFERFATDNGPDLNVYLSAAAADAPADDFATDFIDLGDLKGNIGPQNYEIPPATDLDRYRTVVIWCVRFGVAFGAAELTPAS